MTSKGEESAIESGVYGCEVCVEVGLCMSVWASRCVCGVWSVSVFRDVCFFISVGVCVSGRVCICMCTHV